MNILFCVNSDYLECLVVPIFQICHFRGISQLENPEEQNQIPIHFYIVLDKYDEEKINKIYNAIQIKVKQFNIEVNLDVLVMNTSELNDLPIKSTLYIKPIAYMRLFIEKIYKLKDLKRILYLDADISVSGDLLELFNEDLEDKSIGACTDPFFTHFMYKSLYDLLDFDSNCRYINSGVLLIDVEKWKAKNVVNQTWKIIEEIGDELQFEDQDIINLIFKKDIKYLNHRYNFFQAVAKVLESHIKTPNVVTLDYTEHFQSPIIITHYAGGMTPWFQENTEWFDVENYRQLAKSLNVDMYKMLEDNKEKLKEWNKRTIEKIKRIEENEPVRYNLVKDKVPK